MKRKDAIQIINSQDCECNTGKDCEFCKALIAIGRHAQWKHVNKRTIVKRIKDGDIRYCEEHGRIEEK